MKNEQLPEESKQKQKQYIIDIMNSDEETGLYKLPEEPICTCWGDKKSRPLCPVCDKEKYSEFLKDVKRLKAPPEEIELRIQAKAEDIWLMTAYYKKDEAIKELEKILRQHHEENQLLKAEIDRLNVDRERIAEDTIKFCEGYMRPPQITRAKYVSDKDEFLTNLLKGNP